MTSLSDWAQIAVVLITAVAVWVTLRGLRDQLWIQTFMAYTARYAAVLDQLPEAARLRDPDWSQRELSEDEQQRIYRVFRLYMNLCSEEFFLRSQGKIDRKTWAIWEQGMRETMALPAFARSWEAIGHEYAYFSAFHAFMAALSATRPGARDDGTVRRPA